MKNKLRIAFAGTTDFSAEHLKLLIHYNYNIVLIYTKPDKPSGRGKKIVINPVKKLAIKYNILCKQLDEQTKYELIKLELDLIIVISYGVLIPLEILNIPKLGCINSHASLLPRWRGAAPIQRAIETGDSQTGITIIKIEDGLDNGAILLQCPIAINSDDNYLSLYTSLLSIGLKLIIPAIEGLSNGSLELKKQNELFATYAKKLKKTEGSINWKCSAIDINRKIRAFMYWPKCYTHINGSELKILKANVEYNIPVYNYNPGQIIQISKSGLLVSCSTNALRLTQIQFPGTPPLNWIDVYNGYKKKFNIGQCFA